MRWRCLDRLEQPADQLVVLDENLVSLLAEASIPCARCFHTGRLVWQVLDPDNLVARLLFAPDFNGALTNADLVARLWARRWAACRPPSFQVVARAVPGTDQGAVKHPTLVQRPAHVRASRAHRMHPP